MGIRRDCVSWDPNTHMCRSLTQLVCWEKDCKFFLTPERKRVKDELARERLEGIGYVSASFQDVNGRTVKKRDRAAYQSAYYKNQYEDRKARGMCVRCGIEKASPGRVRCEGCIEIIKKLKRKNVV